MKPISTILTLLLMFSVALSVSAQDIETIKNSKPIQASGALSASTTHELICIAKAFEDIDVKGAVLDASFSITNKDKEKFETALKCARELLSKLKEGIEVEKMKEGGWNCLVEIAALVFRNYAFKKGYDIPKLGNEKLRQVKIAFNMMDPNWYKVNESLITESLKDFYEE